jgi:hypothetical protein
MPAGGSPLRKALPCDRVVVPGQREWRGGSEAAAQAVIETVEVLAEVTAGAVHRLAERAVKAHLIGHVAAIKLVYGSRRSVRDGGAELAARDRDVQPCFPARGPTASPHAGRGDLAGSGEFPDLFLLRRRPVAQRRRLDGHIGSPTAGRGRLLPDCRQAGQEVRANPPARRVEDAQVRVAHVRATCRDAIQAVLQRPGRSAIRQFDPAAGPSLPLGKQAACLARISPDLPVLSGQHEPCAVSGVPARPSHLCRLIQWCASRQPPSR